MDYKQAQVLRKETERKILVTLTMDESLFTDTEMILSPVDFKDYSIEAAAIFDAMKSGKHISSAIIPDSNVAQDYNPEGFKKMIVWMSEVVYRDKVSELTNRLQYELTQVDPISAVQNFNRSIEKLDSNSRGVSFDKISDFALDVAQQIEQATLSHGLTGICTGFDDLNDLTGGWQKGDLIIVAARPGMGKTSLALQYALAAKGNVLIYSLEMSKSQLLMRMASSGSGVPTQTMRTGKTTESELHEVLNNIEKLSEKDIWIEDSMTSVDQITQSARIFNKRLGVDLIVLDYLQLMETNEQGSTNDKVCAMSRQMKQMAKKCDCPAILLSQLSRAVETRGGNKRPILSDLRDSGAIEQDADMVQFIYRPGYYGYMNEDGSTIADEVIIAKHRNGALGTLHKTWIGHQTKFIDHEGEFTKKYEPVNYHEKKDKETEELPF